MTDDTTLIHSPRYTFAGFHFKELRFFQAVSI
jgi:hypothetical protein